MRFFRLFLLVFAAGLLASAGCGRDETINQYEVTHDDREPIQLRVAILPHNKEYVWFFHLSGPKALVIEHGPAFEELVKSVRFDDKKDPPISWTEPKDWPKDPPIGERFASYRIETRPKAMEMKVTLFPFDKYSYVMNLQRWQRQMNLPLSYDKAEAAKYQKTTMIGDQEITWVELNSLGVHLVAKRNEAVAKAKKDLRPMIAPKQPKAAGKKMVPFEYEVPVGWVERDANDGITRALYEIAENGKVAKVTFSSAGGNLATNINRWRGLVKLPPLSPEEAVRSAKMLKVAGEDAFYVDIANPNAPGVNRIVVAIVQLEQSTWFIRLSGPHDWVGQNINTFETFVKSLKLAGR